MKIAILTSGILPIPSVQGGAVEKLIDHYLEYNHQHRLHDITVFSVLHPGVLAHPALLSDVNHYQYIDMGSFPAKIRKRLYALAHPHGYYHYSIGYYLRQAIRIIEKSNDYDCIILENRPGYALPLRHATRAKLVCHLHNDFLNAATVHGHAIYEATAGILTVSDYIRSRVQTCCPQDTKTVTVHNGIDLGSFARQPAITRQSLGLAADDFILVFSGRLIPEKGIVELIEAMHMLKDETSVSLLVMGSSFYDNASNQDDPFIAELRSKAEGLGDRIRFTGYVRHELMPDYLRLADVAVVPSTWDDPFPTTVLEGMAAGLPLITTNRGGIPEMATSRNAVVVAYPGDFVNGLAHAISYLHHNARERAAMGEASLQLSRQYSKEAYAKNFFDALTRCVETATP